MAIPRRTILKRALKWQRKKILFYYWRDSRLSLCLGLRTVDAKVTTSPTLLNLRNWPTLFARNVQSAANPNLFHDVARILAAKLSFQKITQPGWKVLPRPLILPTWPLSITLLGRRTNKNSLISRNSKLIVRSCTCSTYPPQFWVKEMGQIWGRCHMF